MLYIVQTALELGFMYALVALALLVAESLPEQKELMVRLVEHFVLLKQPLTETAGTLPGKE